MVNDDGDIYQRVNGSATCTGCGHHYNDHPRVKQYDMITGEELWLVKACDGSLLKT